MSGVTSISAARDFGLLSHTRIAVRGYDNILRQREQSSGSLQVPLRSTLRKVVRLRQALEGLSMDRLRPARSTSTSGVQPTYASAVAQTALDFGPSSNTELRSVEQVNTAPTSFTAFGPNFVGSTATAPWALGSSAGATISGSYDGSNGSGTLTFRVQRAGTHGLDDLKIRVYGPDDSVLETVNIRRNDPLNQVYSLQNGLDLTLGAGGLLPGDEFTVDTSLLTTSYSPTNPAWLGSTAAPGIGGSYDGSEGSGTLTFRVTRGGVHGQDDLQLKAYAPDGSFLQKIDVKKNDSLNKVYGLDNGLTFTLGAGELVKDNTFEVSVVAGDPGATTPANPTWINSSATATLGGTYDGSSGSGTLTFQARDTGVRGVDDLRVRVLGPDQKTLEEIQLLASDPIDKVYNLSNGLTVTFTGGDLIKNETFTAEVETETVFSTTPHPVASTALVTMGGVYDGAQGTGDLTFQIRQGGVHGADDLLLDVYAPDSTLLETITVGAADPLDQVYTLSNGLTFQAGAGTLVSDESFTVSVNHQIGSRVNPDKAFNGVRNDNPNFDVGMGVTAGSFDINGVTIMVQADDSLNSVLDRINQSAADVTAVFDVATETVLLTRQTAGAENSIVVANDTSGFLAATKLATAVPANPGKDSSSPIGEIASLSQISSGSFRINGVDIALDVAVDSIDAVADRINSSAANVTAAFDVDSGRFSVVANDVEDLVLDSGGTQFFETLTVAPGVYESTPGETARRGVSGLSTANRKHVLRSLQEISQTINDLFDTAGFNASTDPMLDSLRQGVRGAIESAFGEPGQEFQTDFGVNFRFRDYGGKVFRFGSAEQSKFVSGMKSARNVSALRGLLFGAEDESGGLANRLLDVVSSTEREITSQFGTAGIFVDTFA